MNYNFLCSSIGLALAALILPQELRAATTDPKQYTWTKQYAGTDLDLSSYDLSFAEEFDSDRITPYNGSGPWYAPVHASYGSAIFDVPGSNNQTYTVNGGVLTIKASKESDGWHGGNIQTVSQAGKGFAQRFGYFEARMKFPNMPGAWPAFWLEAQDQYTNPAMVRPEIDVVEWYGGDPKGLHSTVHLWTPAAKYIVPGGLTKAWGMSDYQSEVGLAGEWHDYGALISPDNVIIYLDHKEVFRFPTLDEYKVALYPMVSLTLYEQDVTKAVSPFELQVDYVRVYAPKMPKSPSSTSVK
jgi:beta-glucanase (GH16 family)